MHLPFVIQFPRFHAQTPETPCRAPVPIQLPLFADAASLIRVRPERNEWRFYRMEVWPDLFALLLRRWGRTGTEGRRRLDPHADPALPSTHSTASRDRSAS